MQNEPFTGSQFAYEAIPVGEPGAVAPGGSRSGGNRGDGSVGDGIANAFAGLPLGVLVCTPIIEVARGQAELCRVYLDYVFRLAFKYDAQGKKTDEANIITFNLTRPVTDGAGNITHQTITVRAPLIALVPVPAFTMSEATVRFNMEVKEQVVDKSSVDKKTEVESGFSYWGFSAKMTGSVSTSSSHQRTTDQSAKYEIYARAVQHAAAEGMSKLGAVFAATIEPIPVG
ncbi:MAG: DUF2589 domain-containing protein [Burkholderiaceae bacterium]|jgi:hypothetical protein|nr:DUF2589 domain-containing protein [Burkholderiaceae bacterium]